MDIHEYQAKELFDQFGVANPPGVAVDSPDGAFDAACRLGGKALVVKAQVHAGGRGKGRFKNGFQGGVHLCNSPESVRETASRMLGQILVTHQTGKEGKLVRRVLVAQSVEITQESYFAILVDRTSEAAVVVASAEGGVDIEEVAASKPDRIIRQPLHPLLGLQPFQARKIAFQLGFSGKPAAAAAQLFLSAWRLFSSCDCSLLEVNPLVLTPGGDVLALDAKFNFDDNALFRHPEIASLRDRSEEDPREVEASEFDLNYIGLDGNIGCMVNGAGLAMATMDIIKSCGGDPANFLDVGGGANETQVQQAFRILVRDPKVKAILVNIFGGIMRCDVIAQGIIEAAREIELPVPVVVRLEGTKVEEGRQLLKDSGLNLTSAADLAGAAREVVAAAKRGSST
ncbi:MAG TPA: ADP-forming succinate--CoA ligase subunit beta [Verrucomicrobiales bacterium]|nr:ADP-forming succinate--CoA ligase subunit beta [Verrucomicrobiales bacterium]